MVQLADPDATIQIDSVWILVGASTAHEATDEGIASADDASTRVANLYPSAGGSGAVGDKFEVSLESVNDPGADNTNHKLRIRSSARDVNAPISTQGSLGVRMYQGSSSGGDGTLIFATVPGVPGPGEVGHIQLSKAYTTALLSIPEADAAGITDYSDLSVQIHVTTIGTEEFINITTIELEVPDQGKVEVADGDDIVLTGSATIGATGSLAATGAIAATTSATLEGTAGASATGSIVATGQATAVGTGSLSSTGVIAFTGSASLVAIAPISSTATVSITGSAALGGTVGASSTATVRIFVQFPLPIQAAGALAATGAVVITGSANLTGQATDTLTATGAVVVTGSADLNAKAYGSATGTIELTRSTSAQATGDLSASGDLTLTGSCNLRAVAPISSTESLVVTASVAITARLAASCSGALSVTTAGALLVGTAGAVTTSPFAITGTASIRGVGDASATGAVVLTGSSFLSAIIPVGISQSGDISITGQASLVDADLGCAEAIHRHIRVKFYEVIELPLGVDVQYDGESSTSHAADTPWVRLTVRGRFTRQTQTGDNNMFQKRGAMVAVVNYPVDEGTKDQLGVVDAIVEGFRRERYGPVRFRDVTSNRRRRRGAWYEHELTVAFDAYEEVPA